MASSPYAEPSGSEDWTSFLRSIMGAGGRPSYSNYMQGIPWYVRDEMERDPNYGFNVYSSIQGAGQNKAYQDWLGRQSSKYYSQYKAVGSSDPTLFWTDYLARLNPQTDFGWASPYDRGARAGQAAPTMRMVW